jgi:hypothetical protein
VRDNSKLQEEELIEKANKYKLSGRPKIPYFDDKSDDIESYLYRFDKHAASLKWSDEDKAVILPSLLRGRALNYYHELSVEQANDYKKLSEHLLRRFRCTEEKFRTQFRSCKPESGETMHVFYSRLNRYFSRWIEMAGVEKKFEKLCDLVLREQILSSCATSLVTFSKESKYTTADTMIEAAERYREAHPSQNLAAKGAVDPVLAHSGVTFSKPGSASQRGGTFRKFGKANDSSTLAPGSEENKLPQNDSGRGGRGGVHP